MKTREQSDDEEAYWFVRWCQLRAQVKRLKQALDEISGSDNAILRAENQQLKHSLTQIRKDFVVEAPKRKRNYKGNNPNK